MIHYEEEWLCSVLWHYRGSVAFRAAIYAIFAGAVCVVFHVFHDNVEHFLRESGIEAVTASQTWTASTAVLYILLSFRTYEALSRFWEGTSLLHQMRGEWFDSVSCLISFSTCAVKKYPHEVRSFRHTIVRLMSLCHGSALEEIADTDHLIAIDTLGLDVSTLRHLKKCKVEYGFNRVECLLHLFQTLVTKAMEDDIVPIAPPILSRVYQTLSRGFVNLLNAKKIVDTRFPFPYAQLIAQLLFLHLFLTPLMMASLIRNSMVFATICTAVPVWGTFSLNFVATQLENPFGNDDNDLPLEHFQTEMNSSLLMLLHPAADHDPVPSKKIITDFNVLENKGGTAHRRHSICSMSSGRGSEDSRLSSQADSIELNGPVCTDVPENAAAAPEDAVDISLEELEPKLALLAKCVEDFGLALPQWGQMIETQVQELGRSLSALQDLADCDEVEWPGDLASGEVDDGLECFPSI